MKKISFPLNRCDYLELFSPFHAIPAILSSLHCVARHRATALFAVTFAVRFNYGIKVLYHSKTATDAVVCVCVTDSAITAEAHRRASN